MENGVVANKGQLQSAQTLNLPKYVIHRKGATNGENQQDSSASSAIHNSVINNSDKPRNISESISDCEIVEEPTPLIVLDDEFGEVDNDKPGGQNNENDGIGASNGVETSPTSITELFYEDKEPTSNFVVPIYNINDSSLVQEKPQPPQKVNEKPIVTQLGNMNIRVTKSVHPNTQRDIDATTAASNANETLSEFQQDNLLSSTRIEEPNSSLDNSSNLSKTNLIISIQSNSTNSETTRTVISSSDTVTKDKQINGGDLQAHTSPVNQPSTSASAANKSTGLKRKAETPPNSESATKRSRNVVVIDSDMENDSDIEEDSVVFVSETNLSTPHNVLKVTTNQSNSSNGQQKKVCSTTASQVLIKVTILKCVDSLLEIQKVRQSSTAQGTSCKETTGAITSKGERAGQRTSNCTQSNRREFWSRQQHGTKC